MQQRRLRLGDILDDYCPRERRITNHAIVAIVDDEVKQTRCTTCEADHEYKQARIPPARRKRLEGALPGLVEGMLRPRVAAEDRNGLGLHAEESGSPDTLDSPVPEAPEEEPQTYAVEAVAGIAGPQVSEPKAPSPSGDEDARDPREEEDEGPVHRRLIRATLPRPEGQAPERKEPEFTIRQPAHRGGRGRNGRRAHGGGGPERFGQGPGQGPRGPRHGAGRGGQHGRGRSQNGNRQGTPGGHRGNRPWGQGQGRGRKGGR